MDAVSRDELGRHLFAGIIAEEKQLKRSNTVARVEHVAHSAAGNQCTGDAEVNGCTGNY